MKNIISLNMLIGLCLGILWMPQIQAVDLNSQANQITQNIVFETTENDCDDLCGGCDE